jgi:hypothetical protein
MLSVSTSPAPKNRQSRRAAKAQGGTIVADEDLGDKLRNEAKVI